MPADQPLRETAAKLGSESVRMRRLASVDVAFTAARGAMAVLAPGCRAIDSDRNAVFGLTPLSLRSIGEHLSATIGPRRRGRSRLSW
jgi:hypothetical protein